MRSLLDISELVATIYNHGKHQCGIDHRVFADKSERTVMLEPPHRIWDAKDSKNCNFWYTGWGHVMSFSESNPNKYNSVTTMQQLHYNALRLT